MKRKSVYKKITEPVNGNLTYLIWCPLCKKWLDDNINRLYYLHKPHMICCNEEHYLVEETEVTNKLSVVISAPCVVEVLEIEEANPLTLAAIRYNENSTI